MIHISHKGELYRADTVAIAWLDVKTDDGRILWHDSIIATISPAICDKALESLAKVLSRRFFRYLGAA